MLSACACAVSSNAAPRAAAFISLMMFFLLFRGFDLSIFSPTSIVARWSRRRQRSTPLTGQPVYLGDGFSGDMMSDGAASCADATPYLLRLLCSNTNRQQPQKR